MIQIKHSHTGKVIKEVDALSLVNADLQGAELQGADLRYANLRGADLQGAGLQGAGLQGADLEGANLFCAILLGANLQNADLRGANLQDADLRNADLQYANLGGVDLLGADLYNVDIRWAIGEGKRIKTIIDHYRIGIILEYGVMAIGCKQHSIDKWMNFSDEEIDKMATGVLQWWKVWKPRIQQLIAD